MSTSPLNVLRHREFRTVWLAMFASDVGTWMQVGALGIFMAEGTGRAAWVGIVTAVSYLTAGLLAPLGGTLADRHDRRYVTAWTSAGQVVLAVAMAGAFFAGVRDPFVLTLLAGLQGALAALVVAPLSAMIPDLVPAQDVVAAASFFHVSKNIGRAAGPGLAVLVIAVWSYEAVFLLDGLSFAVVALAMLKVSAHPRHPSVGSTWQRLRVGARAVAEDRVARGTVALCTTEMAFAAPFIALVPAMSVLTLGGSASDTGQLFAAQGIGSAVGVLLIAALVPRLGQERSLVLGLAAMGVVGTAYALSPGILVAMLLILPLSGLHSSVLAGSTALLQRDTPPELRGRVLAINFTTSNLGYAAGSTAFALAADLVGLRVTLIAGFLVVFALLPVLHRGLREGGQLSAVTTSTTVGLTAPSPAPEPGRPDR